MTIMSANLFTTGMNRLQKSLDLVRIQTCLCIFTTAKYSQRNINRKKPVVKSILKQPTVLFADLEDETEDEEDDRSDFLESQKGVLVMNFSRFSLFAEDQEDAPKEEKEGKLVPRANIAKKNTDERENQN